MIEYIGTKRVNATPMDRQAYNFLRGWTLPADENGSDEGYLVEYLDGGKPNLLDKGFQGYVSWSPREQFDRAYRPATGLTFGMALDAMKLGLKVARGGWNGKGMWITISGGAQAFPASKFWNEHNRAFAESLGGAANVLPCITMKTATDEIQMGWLASQTDMLAEDWVIVV